MHYQHSESSLRLALLQKSRGRLDLAQFLLASVPEDPAGDAAYLLGDLLETKGMHDLAVIYYRRAVANGHSRAASRIPAGRLKVESAIHAWRKRSRTGTDGAPRSIRSMAE